MRRATTAALLILATLALMSSGAGAAPPPGPSWNGVFSSSAARQPRHVAEAAHFVNELAAQLGVPPGFINSTGAQVHGANLEECSP